MALTATVYHVDLTRGSVETKTVPEDVYRKYPGGSALAAYLLLQAIPAGADPLGPDNVLVMAVSPLTGLAISGQSRMTACARSPLTGAVGDSQCGGFFPAEMRNAGADAIVDAHSAGTAGGQVGRRCGDAADASGARSSRRPLTV